MASRWILPAAGVLVTVIAGWALWRGASRVERTVDPVATEDPRPILAQRTDLAVMPFVALGSTGESVLAAGFGREVTRLLVRDGRVSVIAANSAAKAVSTSAPVDLTADRRAVRLGVEHLLEGGFVWQRDEEISRAEVTVRLLRASDGEVLWNETLEGFFGEIAELQDRVAARVATRLGAADRRGARPVTASPGAYEAYLEGVGRSVQAAGPEELRAAVASFQQAGLLDPDLLFAYTRQVDLWIRLAAYEQGPESLAAARQALVSARRIDPEDPEVRRAAGELELASGGDPSAAVEELEAALERLPGHPGLLHVMALIDRRQGRWDEAIERLTMARRRNPLDLELASDLVLSLAWRRRFDEAVELVERLTALLPEAVEPVLLRADLLVRQRGALQLARAVLEGMPEGARADVRWQESMLRLDLYEGEFESALARLPRLRLEETEELIERAWIERHTGNDRRAAASFERARDRLDDRFEEEPGNPRLSSLLGQAFAGTGGAHLAGRMGQRAVAQLPVTTDAVAGAELVERLARIYLLAGDEERALEELAFLLEIPSPVTVALLRVDPVWRPLHGETSFEELLARFGP